MLRAPSATWTTVHAVAWARFLRTTRSSPDPAITAPPEHPPPFRRLDSGPAGAYYLGMEGLRTRNGSGIGRLRAAEARPRSPGLVYAVVTVTLAVLVGALAL